MVTEDLNTQKPDFVMVDVSKTQEGILGMVDFISYFSTDKNFQAAWQPYHYITTLEGAAIISRFTYHMAIYERTRSPNNL
jgi:hypothetical protein